MRMNANSSSCVQAFLDVKGIGLQPPYPPVNRPYMTGLLVGYEALCEYMMAHVAASILQANNSTIGMVEHYAVIDPGFDIIIQPGAQWLAPALNGKLALHYSRQN